MSLVDGASHCLTEGTSLSVPDEFLPASVNLLLTLRGPGHGFQEKVLHKLVETL